MRLEFGDPDISVRVTDDGRTDVPVPVPAGQRARRTGTGSRAATGAAAGAGGHGVAGMTERAAAFGGTLEAGPRAAGGWEVAATLRDCKAPDAP